MTGPADQALVLSPARVAALIGVHPATVRRWVAVGACPDVFGHLPGSRIGVPAWWVEQLVSSPGAVVGAGEVEARPPSRSADRSGGPHLRTVRGAVSPRSA